MTHDATIETRDLTRAFDGRVAVDGLTLSVDAGEVVALLGPNGAGKTTTVRLLNGVLHPDRGGSRVLGLDPATQGGELRRRTGVLTETSGLDDRLTALENVTTYARIRGIDRSGAQRAAIELLDRFGMSDRIRASVAGFSTGQRKRVALARSLLHRPEVLFLDEPTSGLDPAATREVIDLMATLAREEGRTIVLCTHFLNEASRLCRKIAILESGRLIASGEPAALAASLWPGLALDLDLGRPASPAVLAVIDGGRGAGDVLRVDVAPSGARVHVRDRSVVPALVDAIVRDGQDVYGVVPWNPTLEEIYFALTGHSAEAAAFVDGVAS